MIAPSGSETTSKLLLLKETSGSKAIKEECGAPRDVHASSHDFLVILAIKSAYIYMQAYLRMRTNDLLSFCDMSRVLHSVLDQ